jgi:hypothetical protein
MTDTPTTPPAEAPPPAPADATAARPSPWGWLLIIPVVVPLVTVWFNADDPRILGFPRFYWLQLAWIILGVGTTTLVYQMTKRR